MWLIISVWNNLGSSHFFLSASSLCCCYYGSTGDTKAHVCIVSVWAVVYCLFVRKKDVIFQSGAPWYVKGLKVALLFALSILFSLETVEAWCGMDKQQQNSTVSQLKGLNFLRFYDGQTWIECEWPCKKKINENFDK